MRKYHTRLLTLAGDGSGSWSLTQVGDGAAGEVTGDDKEGCDHVYRKIGELEKRLAEVSEWERRVVELDTILRDKGSED